MQENLIKLHSIILDGDLTEAAKLCDELIAAQQGVQATVPDDWMLEQAEDMSIVVQSPNGERWRYQETTGTGTDSEFIYSLLKAMLTTQGEQA